MRLPSCVRPAVLIALAAGALPAAAHGQDYYATGRGTVAIGLIGHVGTQIKGGYESNIKLFSLDANAGYFIRPELALAGAITFERYTSLFGNTHVVGLGPGATYFLAGPGSRFLPYATGRLLLLSTNSTDHTFDVATSGVSFEAVLGGGLTARLAQHAGLTAEVDLTGRKGWSTSYWTGANTVHPVRLSLGADVFVF